MLHKTREGHVMRLNEMTDEHLRNMIRLAQRRLQPYLDEQLRRKPVPIWLRVWRRVFKDDQLEVDTDYVSQDIIDHYGDEIDRLWEEV